MKKLITLTFIFVFTFISQSFAKQIELGVAEFAYKCNLFGMSTGQKIDTNVDTNDERLVGFLNFGDTLFLVDFFEEYNQFMFPVMTVIRLGQLKDKNYSFKETYIWDKPSQMSPDKMMTRQIMYFDESQNQVIYLEDLMLTSNLKTNLYEKYYQLLTENDMSTDKGLKVIEKGLKKISNYLHGKAMKASQLSSPINPTNLIESTGGLLTRSFYKCEEL